jgi:hypothetical protein
MNYRVRENDSSVAHFLRDSGCRTEDCVLLAPARRSGD